MPREIAQIDLKLTMLIPVLYSNSVSRDLTYVPYENERLSKKRDCVEF